MPADRPIPGLFERLERKKEPQTTKLPRALGLTLRIDALDSRFDWSPGGSAAAWRHEQSVSLWLRRLRETAEIVLVRATPRMRVRAERVPDRAPCWPVYAAVRCAGEPRGGARSAGLSNAPTRQRHASGTPWRTARATRRGKGKSPTGCRLWE